MWVFFLLAMMKWVGALGILLAIVGCPGVIIFPFIFWVVEGHFPLLYFIIWGIGIFIGGPFMYLGRERE
jgi:hypothetical protein